MAQQIQLRNDTTAGWAYANPVLAQAEIGVDTTLGKFKIGNGTSTWSQLQFQSASIADFIFAYDNDEGDSIMTVTDHDMIIRTVRDNDSVGSDCDVNIEAADDVFIRAFGDEVGIYASDEVEIRTNNYDGQGTGNGGNDSHSWTFDRNGYIEFPDGTVQTTSAQGIDPLPSFLTWREGRTHLPDLNTHFGWNSTGLWFQNASEADGINSYPVFTNFTIPQNSSVVVEFDVNINDECSDVGVCVYVDGTTPQWAWDPNTTRIAAQFDCMNLELIGRTTEVAGQASVPEPGLYRVTFIYNPTASTDKVTIAYAPAGSLSNVVETITLNEALPTGPYRVGFAADQNSSSVKTYISYASINVNDGDDIYSGDLDTGNSGTTSDADLVLPVAIKDGDGDDFITFTRTSNNTARIETPQDDLSLRSARDITLFAGSDGPGNVYIGWGDATISPDATNRVATIGDIQSLTTGDFEFNDNVMSTEDTTMKIEAKRNASTQGAAIELRPYDGQVSLYGYGSTLGSNYTTSDWTGNATWSSYGEGGSQVVLTGATSLFTFLDETFNPAPIRFVSINGSDDYEFTGFSGNSGNFTITTQTGAPQSSTTVTSLVFSYRYRSVIEVNDDDDDILIEGIGLDIKLRSTEDITFRSNLLGGTEHAWEMSTNGQFRLPGDGYIENVINGSGEGGDRDTIKIVPDSTLNSEQYIIIDPTNGFEGPDHIHIRPGGTMDDSTVNLILGGEKNAVIVSDDERAVGITTRPPRVSQGLTNLQTETSAQFRATMPAPELGGVLVQPDWKVLNAGTEYTVSTVALDTPSAGIVTITATGLSFAQGAEYVFYYDPPYVNTWAFTSNGYLSGPGMGGVLVSSIANYEGNLYVSSDEDTHIQSGDNHDIHLSSGQGGKIFLEPAANHVYIGTETAGNRVAQVEDLAYIRTAVPTSSIGVEGHVEGMVADDGNFHYYCTGDYDGTNHIWKRVGWTAGTWGD